MSRDRRGQRESRGEGRRAPISDRDPLTWLGVASGEGTSLSSFLRSATIFYGAMGLLGVAWSIATADTAERTVGGFIARALGERPDLAVALGIAVGLLLVAITRLLETWSPISRLVDGFVSVLGTITPRQAFLLAAVSSIGEELLFRGAIQPWLGLWPTSLIFGLLHFPFERRFLAWPFFATGAGLILGLSMEKSGSLLAPIVAHFVVNWINLHFIGRRARQPQRLD